MKPIDGDALRSAARKSLSDSSIGNTIIMIIDTLVDNADELPIKHGKWIDNPGLLPHCSVCGYSDRSKSAFCKNCNSVMEQT